MLLVSNELWELVEQKFEIPEKCTTKEADKLKRCNDKALATIALDVEPEQVHIQDCVSAHEAWIALEQAFEPNSLREFSN